MNTNGVKQNIDIAASEPQKLKIAEALNKMVSDRATGSRKHGLIICRGLSTAVRRAWWNVSTAPSGQVRY